MGAKKTEKVQIQFQDDEGRRESLSASTVGRSLYRVENSPSFAYSVSLNDIVRARRGKDGLLHFSEVVEKSGNRTVRLLLAKFSVNSETAQPILRGIEGLGCSYENLQASMLCVNVPHEVDLQQVVEYLKTLEMWWEYADPTYETLYPAED